MEQHRTPTPGDSAEKAAPTPRRRVSPKPAGKPTALSLRYSQARRLMRDGAFMFKVVVALVVGLLAATIILLAGLGAERQSDIVVNRALIGFSVSAMVMFLACLWLDNRGIPLYVSKHEELQNSWVSEADDAEEEALLAELAEREPTAETGMPETPETPLVEETPGEEESDTEAQEVADNQEIGEEPDGFSPLADTAERLEVPR